PGNVKWGGALAHDGGNFIYALRGNDSRHFWVYDIAANTWAWLADAPAKVKEGGALTYDGSGYIYALRGNDSNDFWRYNIVTNSWSSRADTQDNVKEGGALTCDGGNYVYAFQCEDTESFWRYDISADSWMLMADTPDIVGYGGALAHDGGGYVYALRGDYSQDFWIYDISADSWSSLWPAPASVAYGGALVHDGGSNLYALRGKYSQYFWRYNITSNSWTSRAVTPSSVSSGGALAMAGASYHSSGTLTSAAHDTGYAADFGTISWTGTTPAGTGIKFQVATNNDNATWNFKGPGGAAGAYYTTNGAAIWDGHDGDRYIKYKAFFDTADNSQTLVLHDVSISYCQPIALPAVITGAATLVEETTATLHGTITDDGGEACQYRFEYDTDSGAPYAFSTSWTGSKYTSESFSADITSLGEGTKYYFRAQAKNSAGTDNGSEQSFLTKPEAPVDATFVAVAVSSAQVDLSWTKGAGANRTMVRRESGGFPADINDGFLVYFDTGTSVSDTGLLPETTYYYRAWSEVTGSQQWSDGYRDATATTGEGPPPVTPTVVGGMVYPVNKAQVLTPWLGLCLGLALVAGRVIFGLRKRV
ncbi:hypothetical protein ACFLX3_04975, partial [Chloroflexota bacterium]